MFRALVRDVSPSLINCELSFFDRKPIDLQIAREQHRAYVLALERHGGVVEWLPPLPDSPDAVFVEDTAVVADEVAIVTRPGAGSRRGEVATVAESLAKYRTLAKIENPGTVDGGDVMRVEKRFFVGRSQRTNREAIDQMRAILSPHGYEVIEVGVTGCLHLKSAVTYAGNGVLVTNPEWIDLTPFRGLDFIEVDPTEPLAANVLRLGDTLLTSASYPRTRARLERAGFDTDAVANSELEKAESALTCMSVIVKNQGPGLRAQGS